MQLIRPVIWLSRNAGQDPESPVKDFRPANTAPVESTADIAVAIEAVEVSVTVEEEPDPKGSSAQGSALTSSDDKKEMESQTPLLPVSEDLPVDAAKAKLLHPSSVKTGKPGQPAAA
jgi:hypothetical protein